MTTTPATCPICSQPSDALSPDGYCLRHEAELRSDSSDRATVDNDVLLGRIAWSSNNPHPSGDDVAAVHHDGSPRRPSRRWRGIRDDGKLIRVSCWDRHGAVGLCTPCMRDFSLVLSDVSYLLDDLDVAIAGQVEFVERGQKQDAADADGPVRGGGGNPAVTAHHRLVAALALAGTWFDVRAPEHLAQQLFRHLDQLADEPGMRQVAAQVSQAATRAHRVIDRPMDVFDYGPCPLCGTEIVQERVGPNGTITCPRGDYTATVDVHSSTQLSLNDDVWLPEKRILEAITVNGQPITRKQLRNLVDRGGLPREKRPWLHWDSQAGTLRAPELWQYRVGDVRELAAKAESRSGHTLQGKTVA